MGNLSNNLIVCGLSHGDEGKGACVDSLTRITGSTLNVRFSGGPQCAHNVVLEDGRHHCFAQFGSGSFNPQVRTHIGPHVLVDPLAMDTEAGTATGVGMPDLKQRLSVDPLATIITPFHQIANGLRETMRGVNAHGTTGMGVGETRSMQLDGLWLTVGDLLSGNSSTQILQDIHTTILDSFPGKLDQEYRNLFDLLYC